MSRDPALCRAFIEVAKRFLDMHPHVNHEWSIDDDEDHCVLDFPKMDESGFDIHVEVDSEEVAIYCEGYHDHHQLEGEPNDFANHVVGFLYDLLTSLMRVREYCAGGFPYKWSLECREGDAWVPESTTGLLFYNYFGRKTESFFQNSTLKEREDPLTTNQAEQDAPCKNDSRVGDS